VISRKRGSKGPRTVVLPELCSAERFAELCALQLPSVLSKAAEIGAELTPRVPLPRDTLELLALECGVTVSIRGVDAHRRDRPDSANDPPRSPVVTLMGHVDHGKTSLLDAFRGSSIAAGEAGGITQGISAFMVDSGLARETTFIDTPGHELFSAMRQRGAHATDIIVLVVAVDAGVQDTTREAIAYAKEVGAPLVVAANKIDVVGSEQLLKRLTAQLLENEVLLEEFGGDVPLVPVSATKRINLDELRDAILLQAEMLELRAPRAGAAEGLILEAVVHKGLGVLATAIIDVGRLRPSDFVVAGFAWGRVRTMQDELGCRLTEAPPGTPLRFSGLRELPRAGDELLVVPTEARAKEVSEFRWNRAEAAKAAAVQARRGKRRSAVKSVPLLIKVDSQGSLEAVREGISHFPTNVVELSVVRAAVGLLNEADVQLANAVGAFVVGFNVPTPSQVAALAAQLDVDVSSFDVIYELVDCVKQKLEGAIEPVLQERTTGEAEVLEVFTLTLNRKDRREGMSKKTAVAGSRVASGQATNNSMVRIYRNEEVIHKGRVISLRHFKNEVRSVKKGSEFGMVLHDFSGWEKGDMVVFLETIARKVSLYGTVEDDNG